MATVLVLFVESDEAESNKVMDLLQARLGTGANLKSIKEIVAEGSTLKNELDQSRCVVLVSSKQSYEFIKQEKAEKEGGVVLFDGKLIHEYLQKKMFLEKLIVIQFGKAVSPAYVPDGYVKKVFLLDDNFGSKDPVLDQIEDAIKGMLTSSKVKESEKEKKNGCTLV